MMAGLPSLVMGLFELHGQYFIVGTCSGRIFVYLIVPP